jgi:hypothetical protein
MANTYQTQIVSVTTTGSNVLIFTASGSLIVRDVMIYAKGGAATVSVLYDDRTTDDVVAKESLTADETWRPFAAPIAMLSAHELKVNTSAAVTILITYVEFS